MIFVFIQLPNGHKRKRIFRDAQFCPLCGSIHLHGRDLLHIHADSGYIVRLATQEFLCGSVILLIDGNLGIGIAGQKVSAVW